MINRSENCSIDRDDLQSISSDAVADAFQQIANASKDDVIRLRVEKSALAPVYLQQRGKEGSIDERITKAVTDLTTRATIAKRDREELEAEFAKSWSIDKALVLASGTELLRALCARLGGKFNKEGGDSARLARLLTADKIHPDLQSILTSICSD